MPSFIQSQVSLALLVSNRVAVSCLESLSQVRSAQNRGEVGQHVYIRFLRRRLSSTLLPALASARYLPLVS